MLCYLSSKPGSSGFVDEMCEWVCLRALCWHSYLQFRFGANLQSLTTHTVIFLINSIHWFDSTSKSHPTHSEGLKAVEVLLVWRSNHVLWRVTQDERHHARHVLSAMALFWSWYPVLLIPAPLVDLCHTQPSLLWNSLAIMERATEKREKGRLFSRRLF